MYVLLLRPAVWLWTDQQDLPQLMLSTHREPLSACATISPSLKVHEVYAEPPGRLRGREITVDNGGQQAIYISLVEQRAGQRRFTVTTLSSLDVVE